MNTLDAVLDGVCMRVENTRRVIVLHVKESDRKVAVRMTQREAMVLAAAILSAAINGSAAVTP